ncbi:MAG: nucleotide-binding protein [Sphingomonadales bacterium]|nr:nucleotide-binding protein [Sphingomonadales bacterium]
MPAAPYSKSVFINCAFDDDFRPIFQAVVFAVLDCGFTPRSALEYQDSGEVRVSKIEKLIEDSQLGIHDISRVEPDANTNLPRFNMPYELGLFLGAKRFGSNRDKRKRCLIMDSDPHRYLTTISDLRGIDPESHAGDPLKAISIVRNWLNHGRRATARPLPGGDAISNRYTEYRADLPQLADEVQLQPAELTYTDEIWLMEMWLMKARPS